MIVYVHCGREGKIKEDLDIVLTRIYDVCDGISVKGIERAGNRQLSSLQSAELGQNSVSCDQEVEQCEWELDGEWCLQKFLSVSHTVTVSQAQ